MGFGERIRKLFGGESPEEEAQRVAEKYNKEAKRQADAIRARQERGEIEVADTNFRSMEKGTGALSASEQEAVAARAREQLQEAKQQDQRQSVERIEEIKKDIDKKAA